MGQMFWLFKKKKSSVLQTKLARIQSAVSDFCECFFFIEQKKKMSSEIFLQQAQRITEDHTSPFLFIQK